MARSAVAVAALCGRARGARPDQTWDNPHPVFDYLAETVIIH